MLDATKSDVIKNGKNWVYTDKVKDHFLHPRNIVVDDRPNFEFNGVGEIGSPACGDVMRMWIYVDPKSNKITRSGWKTFGCASAISSTSVLSEMITKNGGMPISHAKKLTARDILNELGGLPSNKIHCSVLGDQALRAAIEDYTNRRK